MTNIMTNILTELLDDNNFEDVIDELQAFVDSDRTEEQKLNITLNAAISCPDMAIIIYAIKSQLAVSDIYNYGCLEVYNNLQHFLEHHLMDVLDTPEDVLKFINFEAVEEYLCYDYVWLEIEDNLYVFRNF